MTAFLVGVLVAFAITGGLWTGGFNGSGVTRYGSFTVYASPPTISPNSTVTLSVSISHFLSYLKVTLSMAINGTSLARGGALLQFTATTDGSGNAWVTVAYPSGGGPSGTYINPGVYFVNVSFAIGGTTYAEAGTQFEVASSTSQVFSAPWFRMAKPPPTAN